MIIIWQLGSDDFCTYFVPMYIPVVSDLKQIERTPKTDLVGLC